MIGTDYPMGMGDFDTVNKVMQLDLTDRERANVLGANAGNALKL